MFTLVNQICFLIIALLKTKAMKRDKVLRLGYLLLSQQSRERRKKEEEMTNDYINDT